MVDREIQKALLSLLRLGLWGKKDMETMFPLSDGQWSQLYQYAQRHTIEGVIFDSFQRLPSNLLPPRSLLLKWTVRIDQIERRNQQMNVCIREQLSLFHAHEVYPVLLKGQGLAACYDIPNHRVCGDVDWYFETKSDYIKVNEILRQRGVTISPTPGFSSEYLWGDVVVEHHKRMFDIHNPLNFSYLDRLQKRFYTQKLQLEFQGNTLLLPAPILMMLQVNVHILKHLLSFGVGIRQLCDASKVYHAFQSNVDGRELKQIYQKLGILKWIHLLHAVLVKNIGLPVASLPFELPETVDADWMMDEIWMAGNFGFFDSRFEGAIEKPSAQRNQASQRVWTNITRYLKYAPMEALSFPLVQFYSKFAGE